MEIDKLWGRLPVRRSISEVVASCSFCDFNYTPKSNSKFAISTTWAPCHPLEELFKATNPEERPTEFSGEYRAKDVSDLLQSVHRRSIDHARARGKTGLALGITLGLLVTLTSLPTLMGNPGFPQNLWYIVPGVGILSAFAGREIERFLWRHLLSRQYFRQSILNRSIRPSKLIEAVETRGKRYGLVTRLVKKEFARRSSALS